MQVTLLSPRTLQWLLLSGQSVEPCHKTQYIQILYNVSHINPKPNIEKVNNCVVVLFFFYHMSSYIMPFKYQTIPLQPR
jgi:hypothetical protein